MAREGDDKSIDVRVQAAQLDAEAIRIARQIRDSGRGIVGLLPASDDALIWPLALQLALSLERIGGRVALLDADAHWPPVANAADTAARVDDTGVPAFFSVELLSESISLLRPKERAPTGGKVPLLSLMLQHVRRTQPAYSNAIVDMTGLTVREGELLETVDMTDGVVTVARAGSTREKMLLRIAGRLSAGTSLGVVLLA